MGEGAASRAAAVEVLRAEPSVSVADPNFGAEGWGDATELLAPDPWTPAAPGCVGALVGFCCTASPGEGLGAPPGRTATVPGARRALGCSGVLIRLTVPDGVDLPDGIARGRRGRASRRECDQADRDRYRGNDPEDLPTFSHVTDFTCCLRRCAAAADRTGLRRRLVARRQPSAMIGRMVDAIGRPRSGFQPSFRDLVAAHQAGSVTSVRDSGQGSFDFVKTADG